MEMNVNRELIKALRLKRSWSQEKLADEAGISLRTVQRIETDGVASLQSRVAIADAFEIEPVDLDIEVSVAVDNEHRGELHSRILSFVLRWIIGFLRGVSIFFASMIGVSLFVMAFLKPLMPSIVGLFTSEMSTSFGVIGNTVNMQEHLGYWVIPLAIIVGCLLFKCVNILIGNRFRI